MKKDHPGVQPEKDGSKCPRAKAAECLPEAALAEIQMSITERDLSNESGVASQKLTHDPESSPTSADDLQNVDDPIQKKWIIIHTSMVGRRALKKTPTRVEVTVIPRKTISTSSRSQDPLNKVLL